MKHRVDIINERSTALDLNIPRSISVLDPRSNRQNISKTNDSESFLRNESRQSSFLKVVPAMSMAFRAVSDKVVIGAYIFVIVRKVKSNN